MKRSEYLEEETEPRPPEENTVEAEEVYENVYVEDSISSSGPFQVDTVEFNPTTFGTYATTTVYGDIQSTATGQAVNEDTNYMRIYPRGEAEDDRAYLETVLRQIINGGNISDANVRSMLYDMCANLTRGVPPAGYIVESEDF